MKKLLTATVALLASATVYTVSAQQGPPHGPPPNVTQAIALLDQAKQQGTAAGNALIDQAETLLKQPPPPHNGPPGGQAAQSASPQNTTQKGAPIAQ